MNFSNKVAITVIALFVSSVANADARLQVEIVPGRGALSETSIALNLLNVGDQTALVDKSSVPTVNGRGMLLDDPFILKQEDGREAEFIGIMRDTLPEVSRSFSIPAGGTFSVDIELAKGYRLSPGLSYKVSLRAPVSYRSGEGRSGSAKSSQQRADKWISAYPAARTIVVPVTGHTIGRASAD